MKLLARLQRMMRANLHRALEEVEDPEVMVQYLIVEMQAQCARAREEVADALAAEQRMRQTAEDADHSAEQWDGRARLALEHGEEELAREALRRRVTAQEQAAAYWQGCERQHATVRRLREALERLERRIAEADAQRAQLLAQHAATRAQRSMADTALATDGDAFTEFRRFADRLANEQTRQHARLSVSVERLDDSFRAAEEAEQIDRALQALREDEALPDAGERRALEHREDEA